MTPLVLLSLLCASNPIQLVDNVGGRHIRLVSDDDDAPRPTLDSMTREQLSAELRRLEESRPGLGGPIALLSVGVVLVVPGAIFGFLGFALIAAEVGMKAGAGTAVGYLLLAGGGVFVLVGVILAVVGLIKLITRIGARRAHGNEIDAVHQRLEAIDNPPQPVVDDPAPAPAPLPPPPPQANLVVPGAMRTLMTF